jgi:hypothetical protein
MIKKAGYMMLATLLIITTVGFVISRHYCDNELISVSIDLPADRCCDDVAGNCCQNENETLILKVDFTQPVSEEVSISQLDLFGTSYVEQLSNIEEQDVTESLVLNYPLPYGTHAFLAKIQSFLL